VLAEIADETVPVTFATVVSGGITGPDTLEFHRETVRCVEESCGGGTCTDGVCACGQSGNLGHFCEIAPALSESLETSFDNFQIGPLQSGYLRFVRPEAVASLKIDVVANFPAAGPNWPIRIFYSERSVTRGIPFEYDHALRASPDSETSRNQVEIETEAHVVNIMLRNDMLFTAAFRISSMEAPCEVPSEGGGARRIRAVKCVMPPPTTEEEDLSRSEMLGYVIGGSVGGLLIVVIVVVVCCVVKRGKTESDEKESEVEDTGDQPG
jgi:hypothetical protein